jgi:hypothetical protein
VARRFEGRVDFDWQPAPIDDTARAARRVQALLSARAD